MTAPPTQALLADVLEELELATEEELLDLEELEDATELEDFEELDEEATLELDDVVVPAYEHHTELLGALGKLLRLQRTLLVKVP
jgi:hypothetical protein